MTNSPAKISAVPVMPSSRRGEMELLFVRLNNFNDLLVFEILDSDLKAVNHAKMFR